MINYDNLCKCNVPCSHLHDPAVAYHVMSGTVSLSYLTDFPLSLYCYSSPITVNSLSNTCAQ